jgi:murein DD-endopeptidase MepM/ murein hydrolase activator NlpD
VRYATVVTTAFVGAGIVAIGAASTLPDHKADPSTLAAHNTATSSSADLAGRQSAADRASRSDTRDAAATDTASDLAWRLPLKQYKVSTPFGQNSLHQGMDLAAPEGTPYFASHGGVVTLARYDGGLGYTVVVDVGGETTITYGHSAKILVREGQRVQPGDALGLVGASGYAFDNGLYFEIRVNNKVVNPVTYLSSYGIDVTKGIDPLSS